MEKLRVRSEVFKMLNYEDVEKEQRDMYYMTNEQLLDYKFRHYTFYLAAEKLLKEREGYGLTKIKTSEDSIFEYLTVKIVIDKEGWVKKQDVLKIVKNWLKDNNKNYVLKGFLKTFKNHYNVKEYHAYDKITNKRYNAFKGIRLI